MLVDIANEQANSAEVFVVVGNDQLDSGVLSCFSPQVKIQCLGRPRGSRNPLYFIKLYRMLRAISPDIIHAHQESFIKILKFLPYPRVLTVHNTGIELTDQRQHYHALYAISQSVAQDIHTRYPDVQPVLVLNGIPCKRVRSKTCYGGVPFRIVQIGRLDHCQKGQDVLLNALSRVVQTLGHRRVHVAIIGDGESREFLENIVAKLDLSQTVEFLGQKSREQIYREIGQYDLLVQPSRFEGFGLTVVEAMAAGVPVLVSDIEGPMEIIRRGKYGHFFELENQEACADQIMEVFDASRSTQFPARQTEIAKYAHKHFDISVTAKRYLEEYGKISSEYSTE